MTNARPKRISVCELEEFVRGAAKVWTPDELDQFIDYICVNPTAGDLIEGTGGVRKLRWSRANTGKSGGVRVIHYYYSDDAPLFLLGVYAKSRQPDIAPAAKAALRHFTTAVKAEFGRAKKKRLQ